MTAIALTGQRSQAKRDADARYYNSPKGQANRLRKAIKRAAEDEAFICKFPTPETVSISYLKPVRGFPSLHAAAEWFGLNA